MAFETVQAGDYSNRGAVVLDNSVMMRWIFDDGSPADQRYAQCVLNFINTHRPDVLVPYVWIYEAAFVVNYYVNGGVLDSGQARCHLDALFELSTVAIDRLSPAKLFEFSNVYAVSAYDAAYLILAQSQGSAIATLDKKMRRVARKVGVELLAGV